MARVLLVAPSAGLGGGIERYLGTVEECLRQAGAEVHRVNLLVPGTRMSVATRTGFAALVARTAVRIGKLDAVVVGLPGLVWVGAVAAWLTRAERAPVMFYGQEIPSVNRPDRALLAKYHTLRPLTISSFSAGALSPIAQASVLPPGIVARWRETLIAAGSRRRDLDPVPTVLTVFRLAAWESKGLPELLEALTSVRRALGPVRLVVAGQGPAPRGLIGTMRCYDDARLYESPSDEDLAGMYASADLFALCARTDLPRSGEGYGIVLMEAQLAGCAVIGPAHGGSRDAYQPGLTGATPADESAGALAATLHDLLGDRAELARTGRRAAGWARDATIPESYMRAVFSAIVGTSPLAARTPTTVPVPRKDSGSEERAAENITAQTDLSPSSQSK